MNNFTVLWFNPDKNSYDNCYIPNDYLKETQAKLIKNNNFIDTKLSLAQLYSYSNGYDLVDNIFEDIELISWIKHNETVDYRKYKYLVDKVAIK